MARSFAFISPRFLPIVAALVIGGPASGATTFDGPQSGLESAGQTLIFVRLLGDPGAPVPAMSWFEWDGGTSASYHDPTAHFDPTGHWSYTWQVCDGCAGDPSTLDDSEGIGLMTEPCQLQYGTWTEGKAGTYTRTALRTPTFASFPSGQATEGEPMFNLDATLTGGTPLSAVPPALIGWQNLDTGGHAYWPDHDSGSPWSFDAAGNLSCSCGYWQPDSPIVWEGDHDRVSIGCGETSYGIWRRRNGALVREPLAEAIEPGSWGQIKARFH